MYQFTLRLLLLVSALALVPLSANAAPSDKNQKHRSYDITGVVSNVGNLTINISGQTHKLSPVAKVHSPDKSTVLVSELPGMRVGCTLERLGNNAQVKQIWILSEDEPDVVIGL
jgi:hypothetical protein